MERDEDVLYVMQWCRAIGVSVHIRGTDDRPVIEVREGKWGNVVGGSEMRRRMERKAC